MKKFDISQAAQLTSPNPVTVICTLRPDGGTNLAALSWWSFISMDPQMLCFAMSKPSYSGELVRKTRKALITVPGAALSDAVMQCGSTSGRDTDKALKYGVELAELAGSKIKYPLHSRLVISCGLKEFHEAGDHCLYICNIDQMLGNEDETALFAWGGYTELKPASLAGLTN